MPYWLIFIQTFFKRQEFAQGCIQELLNRLLAVSVGYLTTLVAQKDVVFTCWTVNSEPCVGCEGQCCSISSEAFFFTCI